MADAHSTHPHMLCGSDPPPGRLRTLYRLLAPALLRDILGEVKVVTRLLCTELPLRGYISWLVARLFGKPQVALHLRSGVEILAPLGERNFDIIHDVFVDRIYLPRSWTISAEDTVLDIGAHVGVFTLWAGRMASRGRIIALEPSPRMFDFLTKNVERNRLTNAALVQFACAQHRGEADLFRRGPEWGNSLYPGDLAGRRVEKIARVRLITLSDVFVQFDLARCDLLKMNCEGAEYTILLSCPAEVLHRIRRMSVQYHLGMTEHTVDELVRYLSQSGFLVQLRPRHEEGGMLYAERPTR